MKVNGDGFPVFLDASGPGVGSRMVIDGYDIGGGRVGCRIRLSDPDSGETTITLRRITVETIVGALTTYLASTMGQGLDQGEGVAG